MMKTIAVQTKLRHELVNITFLVQQQVYQSEVKHGLVLVFCLHTTAALLITEHEPKLKLDWLSIFGDLVPKRDFRHNEIDNNAEAHIIAGLIGPGKALAIEDNNLALGTYQQIFLVELDGPRERKIVVRTAT